MAKRRFSRWQAAGIHLTISATIASLSLALILGLWFPGPLFEAAGGLGLIFLLVCVDVTVGPLLTLIVSRALYDLLLEDCSTPRASGCPDSIVWDFVGGGAWFGIPTVVFVYAAVAIFGHIFLTRLRPGWHVIAIGGSPAGQTQRTRRRVFRATDRSW